MISAPSSSRSRCSMALTVPCVPTGMNAGVCTTPCGVWNSPRRAAPSVPCNLNSKAMQCGAVPRGGPADDLLLVGVTKLRVGVIFGGKSGEHEVSVASAASIFKHLDRTRYEPVPIRIEKDGRWVLTGALPTALSAADVLKQRQTESLEPVEPTAAVSRSGVDVVFPVLHGPYGEDGTVQGLLELANVPYVGCGVLASAAGMDKAVMKVLFAARGLPVGPYLAVVRREWEADADAIAARVERDLRYPVFVKPANLGSSVGISKARSRREFDDAMKLALEFDRKVVIEAAVPNAREIECSVLGNDEPDASVPGEVIPSREFYDYEAKYLDEGSQTLIPAPLTDEQAASIRR